MLKGLPKILAVCEAVTKYSIYILVFLVPILFLPWTSDILDVNKQAATVLFSFVALFFWLAKCLAVGKITFRFNRTHFAVLALFLACLLSTIFSQDSYGSFWGWPRVVSESLLTLISFALIYFFVAGVFSKKEAQVSLILLALSGALAILLGVLHLFGLFLPFNFAKSTSFNTIGLVGSFGFFVAILLPLLIGLAISAKKWLKIIFIASIALSFLALVLVNYYIVWWAALLGSVLIILFSVYKKDLFDARWLGLPMFFLVVALFFIILNPQIPLPAKSTEVNLNQKATFDVALKAVKDAPVLGSGPGTFSFAFGKYRSVDFNQGRLWNLRFGAGSSKVLTALATTGILGFISLMTLMATALYYGVKFLLKKPLGDSASYAPVAMAAFTGFIVLAVSFFFYNSSFTIYFLFFFLAAVFAGLSEENKKEFSLNPSSIFTLGATFVFTLAFIFGLGILFLNGQRYLAETNYVKGVALLTAGKSDEGAAKLEDAARMNPRVDTYFTELSGVYLAKLQGVLNDKNMPEDEKTRRGQLLVSNSINAAKIATDINPRNASNWLARGFVYQNLIGLVPDSAQWAINSYEEAVKLEPTNPYYLTQQGMVYMIKAATVSKDDATQKNQDYAEAKKKFDKAVELKSDYAAARFQIAMLYQAQGKTAQEAAALEEAIKNSPNDVGVLFQAGVMYYQAGNYTKTKQTLEAATVIAPNYANALYYLGLAYSRLGEKDKAVSQFQKIEKLNPENAEVKKIISNLQAGKPALDGIAQEIPQEAPVKEEEE